MKGNKSGSRKSIPKPSVRSTTKHSSRRRVAESGFQSFIIRKSHYNTEKYIILRDINSSFMSDIISKIIHGLFGSD